MARSLEWCGHRFPGPISCISLVGGRVRASIARGRAPPAHTHTHTHTHTKRVGGGDTGQSIAPAEVAPTRERYALFHPPETIPRLPLLSFRLATHLFSHNTLSARLPVCLRPPNTLSARLSVCLRPPASSLFLPCGTPLLTHTISYTQAVGGGAASSTGWSRDAGKPQAS